MMKIYIAGHNGLVGSALVRAVEKEQQHTWVGKSRSELDLLNQQEVLDFLKKEKPDAVVMAAAKVGGIGANSKYPVDFLSENLQIQLNLINSAHYLGLERLIFLGSSCIYPKASPQPIREEHLLTGLLEPTNEPYAIAKIAGLKLVEAYKKQYGHNWVSLMPTNLYGPGDNYDLENSHVLPALVRKFVEGKKLARESVRIWGSGAPKREFLHSDDLARAILLVLESEQKDEILNVGSGLEVSVKKLAQLISEKVGYEGAIEFDTTLPDGTPRKLLNSDRIRSLGFSPSVSLERGLEDVVNEFSNKTLI